MSNDVNADLPRLLREVKSSGYRVSNLCHRADGMVQCNLRAHLSPLVFHWGYGPSFVDAVTAALENARKGKVAHRAPVGDDAMDPRKIGNTVDPTDHVVKHARYFYHPESDALMMVLPGEPDPREGAGGDACLVEEIDYAEYQKIQGKQEAARQKARVKSMPAPAAADDDEEDLVGGAPKSPWTPEVEACFACNTDDEDDEVLI